MASITISINADSDAGLHKLLKSLQLGNQPVPAEAPVADQDKFDPNAYKPAPATDAELRAGFTTAGETLTVRGAPSGDVLIEPGQTATINVMSGAVTLSDMDGDRKRGEAAPGHRRRTNAQIESDREWMAQKARAEAALAEMDEGMHPLEAGYGGSKAISPEAAYAAVAQSISSGDERLNPEDEADEAAETAERKSAKPTLEDLRAAVARYIEKFGHASSVKNMKTIIGCAVAEVPEAEIGNAIAKVNLAISGSTVITPTNPATGKPSDEPESGSLFADEPAAPVTATPAEVVEAIKAYARLYDGNDTDQDAMVFTKEDLPKVFGQTFGKGVTGIGSLPDKKPETLGKILVAIRAATEGNPFKRTPK